MPPVSKLNLLPKDVKDWLDAELEKRGYGLLSQITALLAEKGYAICRTSVGIYSYRRKKKLEKIAGMREWAREIIGTVDRDGVDMSLANTAILQQMIFDLFSDMDFSRLSELPLEKRMDLVVRLGRLQPELSRSFISLETYKTKFLKEIDELEKLANEQKDPSKKLDMETLRQVRERVYGL